MKTEVNDRSSKKFQMAFSSKELGGEWRKGQINFKPYSNKFQNYAGTLNPRRQCNNSNSTNYQTSPIDKNKENLCHNHMVSLTNIKAENHNRVEAIALDNEKKSYRSSDDDEVQAINTSIQIYNENDDVGRDRSGRSNPAIPTAEIVGRASNFDLFKGLKQRNATLFD